MKSIAILGASGGLGAIIATALARPLIEVNDDDFDRERSGDISDGMICNHIGT